MNKRKVVAVYGSSRGEAGSADYEQARSLGRQLAEAGFAVMNGGYGGTMQGVSQGANEAGGQVIGVTVELFESSGMRGGANPFVTEVVHFASLRERLLHLILACDAGVVLPGGLGTLTELMLTWNLVQVGEVPPRPFVLVGQAWADLLWQFYGDGRYIRASDMTLWQAVESVDGVLPAIRQWEADHAG
ncbi:MAG: LOG family protein [Chloroflexi bacterium]|nr:LOG family protein [Chloroflexota bacterium]